MSEFPSSPEAIVSRPIAKDDERMMEILNKAVAPASSTPWSEASAKDIARDVRRAMDALLAAPMRAEEVPLVVSPAQYRKAQNLLGVHDRPLTNADLWEAAFKEIEQAGLDPFEVIARMWGGPT